MSAFDSGFFGRLVLFVALLAHSDCSMHDNHWTQNSVDV
jgi:hypothetical protein